MNWPESSTWTGGLHRYAYVRGAHDPFAVALGRNPHGTEVILHEAGVDVRLWEARTVWFVHRAYKRRAKVLGPFTVRSIGVETSISSATGMEAFVRVYERRGHLSAHYCWALEADATSHAALLNARAKGGSR